LGNVDQSSCTRDTVTDQREGEGRFASRWYSKCNLFFKLTRTTALVLKITNVNELLHQVAHL